MRTGTTLKSLGASQQKALSMLDELAEEYPDATPYIRGAVKAHGEDWVIENYYTEISQLGVVMAVPAVEELPFYAEDEHEVMRPEDRAEMANALGQYRENLRTGTKPGDDE